MGSINGLFGHLQGFVSGHYAPSSLLATAVLFLVTLVVLTSRSKAVGEPLTLWDPIPYVFNTLQFVTNNDRFMQRVSYVLPTLESHRSHCDGCRSRLLF